MFLNKFLLIGGGMAVAGTGTVLGVYYGTQGNGKTTDEEKPKEKVALGNTDQNGKVNIPKIEGDPVPHVPLRSTGN